MRHAKAILVVFWFVCFCACSTQLIAQTTTHGTITTVYPFEATQFTLTTVPPGGNAVVWTLTGEFDNLNTSFALCNPCSSMISVNGLVVGNDFQGGTASLGVPQTTYYPSVNWGSLNAPGPSIFTVTGPDVTGVVNPGNYVSTFSFTGALCGVIVPFQCAVNLPNLASSGTGIVYVIVGRNAIGQLYETSVTYAF